MLNSLQINPKIIPYLHLHRAIDESLKIPEKCWLFLYLNFTRILQFSSTTGVGFLSHTPENNVKIIRLISNLVHIIDSIRLLRMQNFKKFSVLFSEI